MFYKSMAPKIKKVTRRYINRLVHGIPLTHFKSIVLFACIFLPPRIFPFPHCQPLPHGADMSTSAKSISHQNT